jgi:signal transduction histidine kinase
MCHARVERARARAARAAEEAIALRTILKARAKLPPSTQPQDRAIWNAAARAVADMARERDRILGTVSHEMRQALAAALAAEHLLVQHPSEPSASKAANVLDRQLLHLAKLVEVLLDYSRLTAGTAEHVNERFDLRDVVRETLDACQVEAGAVRIECRLSLWDDGQPVEGDPTQIRQLVSNLVHNALRYTPAGGRVQCTTMTREDSAHILVSDTGIGIAEEDLERIFEPFTRAATIGQGLGVGLAIARRIAQLHGGDITAQSHGPGNGSTFTAILPLARSTA